MLFSVCIPVYNAEKYLEECVSSVLRQTYPFFEIILVDDGSKDGSCKICQDLSKRDERIRFFSKENEGQLATRLFAFSKAKGNIFICLDSDDYLDDNSLETINNYFAKYDCDCLYFGWRRFYDSCVVKTTQICDEVEIYDNPCLKYKKILGNSNFNSMCLKAVKSSVVKSMDYTRFYKLRMGEDLIQTIDIVKRSDKILLIPDVIYNYRINPQSATENISLKNCDIDDLSREYVLSFLRKENVFSDTDWNEYGVYCNDLFFYELIKISSIPISLSERLSLLGEKRKNAYYNQFVREYQPSKKIRKLCLYFFQHNIMFGIVVISLISRMRLLIKK